MAEATIVEYVGTVKALSEGKNGWYTIEIAIPGSQYTKKPQTKRTALIDKAREVRDAGTVCTFKVKEKESDRINPNNNLPYIDRMLEGIEEGATASPAGGNDAQSAGQYVQQNRVAAGSNEMTKEEWRAKDAAADKRACIAIAVSALTHTMPSDPDDEQLNVFNARVLKLAGGWYRVVTGARDNPSAADVPFE